MTHRSLTARPPVDIGSAILACVAAGLLGVALWHYNSTVDDAFISFRYADNWISGHGLVFNPGERVEGYTNFLWIAVIAPFRLLGVEPESAAFLLSIVGLGLILWAAFSTASRLGGSSAGWSALILAGTSLPLIRWTSSGMETVFYAALIVVANERLAALKRHSLGSSILFGLAVLTRPEGVALVGLSFLAAAMGQAGAVRQRIQGLLVPAMVFASFPVVHTLFRLSYYGLPLPNTFYAKLGGQLPDLVPYGLIYVARFLGEGGIILIVLTLLSLRNQRLRSWVVWALLLQIAFQFGYAVRVGGDYFPFHRFLVPVIPHLSILSGLGLGTIVIPWKGKTRFSWLAPALALILGAVGMMIAWNSHSSRSFRQLIQFRADHELVAEWINASTGPGTLLAVNVAGRIPYRTGLPTLDMLGLNDRHIAMTAGVMPVTGGSATVGHFKHDGDYVCRREPGLVVTSDGSLHPATSPSEAEFQAALNTFPGDREFLQDPRCKGWYEPLIEELRPGQYAVAYSRRHERSNWKEGPDDVPLTGEGWFDRGLGLMKSAHLAEAIEAFQHSLELEPDNMAALVNLGFCLFDLQRYSESAATFERLLELREGNHQAIFGLAQSYEKLGNVQAAASFWRRYIEVAPESSWKQVARDQLFLLTGEKSTP